MRKTNVQNAGHDRLWSTFAGRTHTAYSTAFELEPADPVDLQGKHATEAVDGSNCPTLPQEDAASHSLLLEHGLFRIERPWPPRDDHGGFIEPEFTIEVVKDPNGCNQDPTRISVYRRPRPAANLRFVTATGFAYDPKNGRPLRTDSETGVLLSGNVTADDRVHTLKGQALDALITHMQWYGPDDDPAIQTLLEFEQGLITAQSVHNHAGSLTEAGAQGGPNFLAATPAGRLQSSARDPIWGEEFGAWLELEGPAEGEDPEQYEYRKSVARGAEVFAQRTFLVDRSAGLTDTGFGTPVRNACAWCHNMKSSGMDVAPGQVDLGTTNQPHTDLAASNANDELPLFRVTCKPGKRPHAHLGEVVYTHDPGLALTSGKCIDIGKITIQPLRGIAARAPYFSNGSAKTLREVVDYYDDRYSIGYTEQEKQDLVHLMEAL